MLAQEPIPVIRALTGENAEMREEKARNNRAASGRSVPPGIYTGTGLFFYLTKQLVRCYFPNRGSEAIPLQRRRGLHRTTGESSHKDTRPSSAGAVAPPGRGCEFNPLSLDSVDLCPSSVLNSLLKPSHTSASTLSLKRPQICCLGRPCFERDPQGSSYLL